MPGKIRIGCSGWSYPSWRPAFYPAGTPAKKLLEAYAGLLNTVEVNYTFRRLPAANVIANWLAQTPAHFRFACKAPQRITHVQRLAGAVAETRAFALALAPLALAERLGPILFQLPPGFHADAARLDLFLAEIAPLGLHTTWEFRHESWFNDAVYAALRRHGATLCAAESDTLRTPDIGLQPGLRVYRLRRSEYTAAEMDALAAQFAELAATGTDIYAFFKHEEKPDGALRAVSLLDRITAEQRG